MKRRMAQCTVALLFLVCLTLVGGASAKRAAHRPNIIFVLTADLAWNLVQYMPHVQDMQAHGTTFANYFVTDSLCCPSRSSIFTGNFPHDTGIVSNGDKGGGFTGFRKRGEESSTFATSLRRAGYRTAFLGKYFNGYQPKDRYVPPGWTEWDVTGDGYSGFDYNLNENHHLRHYGQAPKDYLTDVISGKAADFITASAAAHAPFLVEVATFAPHHPYTPAPRDANSFAAVAALRGPAYNKLPADAPGWLAGRTPLTAAQQNAIDTAFRKRVQAVQAVDRMIGNLQETLSQAGVADDTLMVFSSDNGYHMGEYRLGPGKMTAFDTDVRVPLVMAGAGVAAGQTVAAPVENIDLRPTFEALGGAATPSNVDGRSLIPLLGGKTTPGWRTAALVEHHGPDTDPADPDQPGPDSGNPPTYSALRTTGVTYVEYADGTREYYDRTTDPDELHNTVGSLPPDRVATLHQALAALVTCHDGDACWRAGHLVK
jgi:N-acetylglucosamine-6-sulfatase